MKLTLTGGRVVDPVARRDEVANVHIDGERIVGVGRAPAGFKAARVVDAADCLVCPGFTDIGARLREPGFEYKATIASELEAAAAGGFTTVCCTPDTQPVIDTPAVVELIHQRARGVRGARVHCIGALTQGLGSAILAEMGALKDIGCVGVSNAGRALKDTSVLKNALAYAATLDLTVFLDAEDAWLAGSGVMHAGAVSTRLVLVESSGVRAHFRTVSCARAVKQLSEARRAGLAVSADVGIAHLSLSDQDIERFDANYHVRPPLRTPRDRTRLIKALAEGHIEAVTAHHEPHDADAKAGPFGATQAGISGFDTFAPLLLARVAQGDLDLMRAIEAAAVAPARVIGVESRGITPGAAADICIIDPAHVWRASADQMLSRGKNTPYRDRQLRGRVRATLVAGRLVYELKA